MRTNMLYQQALELLKEPAVKNISRLPENLLRLHTTLTQDDFQLLLLKQRKLCESNAQIPNFIGQRLPRARPQRHATTSRSPDPVAQASAATLVFAQEEAGTAVCISANGLLLTCSHCVAETEKEMQTLKGRTRWLLFSSGQVVRAECLAWDARRDLALLSIVKAQDPPPSSWPSSNCRPVDKDGQESTFNPLFPAISIATSAPTKNTPLFCIGHPGSEDLEASTAGIATNYDVLHISEGRFRGLHPDCADAQDNSEIGALMHDCWTYWGHSGAPLMDKKTGRLMGLHSSWDDETGMRRGIPWEAIIEFLREHTTLGSSA